MQKNLFTATDKAVFFYDSNSVDPYWNLAVEEHLFHMLPIHASCLYLWQNNKTVVIGNYQNTVEEINRAYIEEHQIKVARRMSGGGAVYHDLGNLNYSVITDIACEPSDYFAFFTDPVLRALRRLNVPAERNGRNDIMVHGRKVSGCAQYKDENRLLFHGCIMLDTNLQDLIGALNVNGLKVKSYSTKSVFNHVTTINKVNAHPVSVSQFKKMLIEEFLLSTSAIPYVFSPDDLSAIIQLQREKYETWDWNYGHYAEYNIQKERKYPYGLVQIYMNVKDACIQDIRFQGDFFGDGNIQELSDSLKGLRLDDHLEKFLNELPISHFIHGMSASDLNSLINY